CDAWVVWALPGCARAYATALVDALDYLAGAEPALPPLASGISPITDLKRRLTMIMRGKTHRSLGWPAGLAVVGLALMALPLVPAWVRAEPEEKHRVVKVVGLADDREVAAGDELDLEKLEAELKAKLDKIKAAKAKLKAKLKAEADKVRSRRVE